MVRALLVFTLLFSFAFGSASSVASSFVDSATYSSQRNLINAIFSKESQFTRNGQVDTYKVVKTLKANGLLKLSYATAVHLRLNFDVTYRPLLAMRIINDALEKLGYTYYLSTNINKHKANLSWGISINTQNILDPVLFSNELRKRGCAIKRIQKSGELYWSYNIDARNATLDTVPLNRGEEKQLRKPNIPYWFNVANASQMQLSANPRDSWYPELTFFDANLLAIGQISLDKKANSYSVKVPQNATYLKVDDKFLLDNIKRGLKVKLD